LFFRSFYGSSEPGTPPHRDSIPSKPVRPLLQGHSDCNTVQRSMAVGSNRPEIAQIGAQGVAVLRIQRVMLDHVFQVVNRGIELPFVEVTLGVIPVEIGKVSPGVLVPGDFLCFWRSNSSARRRSFWVRSITARASLICAKTPTDKAAQASRIDSRFISSAPQALMQILCHCGK
jgi:hypothetical protein